MTISKSVCTAVVTENGQLTYTFVIENSRNTEIDVDNSLILSDTFNPVLDTISVAFNGTAWIEGVNYNYNILTDEFTTLVGQITVPQASYVQGNDGVWTVIPGISTLKLQVQYKFYTRTM